MTRTTFLWQALAVLVAGSLLAHLGTALRAADAPPPLPRYRLQVGQEISYKEESEFKYGKSPHENSLGTRNEWHVWVVRKNDDGSDRIVVRCVETRRFEGKDSGSSDSNLAYCDVFPDGRIVSNSSVGFRIDPSSLFPRLPADQSALDRGWQNAREHDDGVSSFKLVTRPATGSGALTFHEVRKSPMDEIYLSTNESTATFDRERGLVAKVVSESTQHYGADGKGTGTLEFVGVKEHDAQFTKQLWEQADRFFQAQRAYQEKIEQASKDDEKLSKKRLEEAKAILTSAESAVSLPIVKEQLKDQLKAYDQMASYIAEEAVRRAKVVGHPAADWEAPDLKGKPHSLKEYRGKVVILDFWYRGCGWCMRAMPQVKHLAAEFRGEPVVVLGMNTDRDKADAQFVVDKMGLDYATLKIDHDLPEKYGVRGFPTLVIIDKEGKIHDLHVGYSPTLEQQVGKIVRDLLAKR